MLYALRYRVAYILTQEKIISRKMGPTIGTSSHNPAFKRSRKETALGLGAPAVKMNLPHIDRETWQLVTELLSHGNSGLTPVEPSRLAARMALSLSASLCYGRQMSLEDPLTDEILSVEDATHFLRSTTGNLQDYIPLFRRWPLYGNSQRARRLQVRRDAYVVKINHEANCNRGSMRVVSTRRIISVRIRWLRASCRLFC